MNFIPSRRRVLVYAGIVLAIPVLAIAVVCVLIAAHRITPERIEPPANMLQVKPAAPGPKTNPPKNFESILAAGCGDDVAALYSKIDAALGACDRPSDFGFQWDPKEPLSAENEKWLLDHRDLIADIMKLAEAGGKPLMPCEEALAFGVDKFNQLPLPNLLSTQRMATILCGESRRLRKSGDMEGAAKALLAVEPLAQMIKEPCLISGLVAVAMRSRMSSELAWWLKDTPPPEIAKELRQKIAAMPPLDIRRVMECEYRGSRYNLVNKLNGSIMGLMTEQLGQRGDPNIWIMLDDVRMKPGEAVHDYTYAALTGTYVKATADTQLSRFDEVYANGLKSLSSPGSGESFDAMVERIESKDRLFYPYYFIPIPNIEEPGTRNHVTQTGLELGVAGLDEVVGGESAEPRVDPFSGKPLKRIHGAGDVTIYSVGPDREDQHATIAYDPTNGTRSAGDIMIRVKR